MKLTRRELAPLALSIGAACAAPAPPVNAQPPRRVPPRGQHPPPVPTPRREGDIGGLLIESQSVGGGTMVLIGHAFPPGALPRGHGLAVRLATGDRPIDASLQVLTRHPDGSARVGMIAVMPPPLPPGRPAGVILARTSPSGASR